jgi:hypothetical protein
MLLLLRWVLNQTTNKENERSEVLTVVTMKNAVFWDFMLFLQQAHGVTSQTTTFFKEHSNQFHNNVISDVKHFPSQLLGSSE